MCELDHARSVVNSVDMNTGTQHRDVIVSAVSFRVLSFEAQISLGARTVSMTLCPRHGLRMERQVLSFLFIFTRWILLR